MKIAHIETGMHLYGGAQQVLYLLQGLQQQGVDNVLIAPVNSAIARAANGTVPVITTRHAGDLSLSFYRESRRALKKMQPDIVHLHSRRGADVIGGLAAKSVKIPSVLSRRVDNREPSWLAKIKYRMYHQVVGISQAICRVLINEGVPAEKLRCIHSAVDTDAFDTKIDKHAFNAHYGIPRENLTIAIIAQLIPRKGHQTLFDALPGLLDKYKNLTILIFGQGPEAQRIRRRIKMQGWAPQVRLMGFDPTLDRYLSGIDIIVHPAEKEGLGVALLKASAAGVPVIAGNAGGIPEIIQHKKNGYLFTPGDSVALHRHIDCLLNDQALRQHMGTMGQEIVKTHFSIQRMVNENLALYKQILESSKQITS